MAPKQSNAQMVLSMPIEKILERIDQRLDRIESKIDTEVQHLQQKLELVERSGSHTAQEAIQRVIVLEGQIKTQANVEERLAKVEREYASSSAVGEAFEKFDSINRSASQNRIGLWVVGVIGILQMFITLAATIKK